MGFFVFAFSIKGECGRENWCICTQIARKFWQVKATIQVAMITLKLTLDKRRAKRDNTYPFVFRINRNGVVRDIPTGYSILETNLDEKNFKLKKSFPDFEKVAPHLRELQIKYLGKIIE